MRDCKDLQPRNVAMSYTVLRKSIQAGAGGTVGLPGTTECGRGRE